MKNIIKLLTLSIMVALLATSCGEEPFDVADGGTQGANLYTTSAVKYYVGVSTEITVELETFENEGANVSSINYTAQLSSELGTSDVASFSVGGGASTISTTLNELLTSLPVNGTTYTEVDLIPGDVIEMEYTITLGDGSVLNPPASTTISILCAPAPGDYEIFMHDSYGDGWQTDDGSGGAGLQVTLDAGESSEQVIEVGMCSPYLASTFDCVDGDGFNAQDIISIPTGTVSADWFWPGDFYGEISFEIYSPDGVLLFEYLGGEDYSGTLPIINCVQ